ncbi:MAG TPA: MEDS domain-containing protein [Gemmatimonadaceae bacterium]|nr:MEDS domain-containing protein [Gemmatimonadaceae bacterium]
MSGSSMQPKHCDHVATIFRTEDFFRERVASFIAEGVAANEQVIVVATPKHRQTLEARLDETGIAVGRAVEDGGLLMLDAYEVLAGITVNGVASVERFRVALNRLIEPRRKQRVYGELVSLLAQRGDLKTALAIEALGHELSHTLRIPVLCGYEASSPRVLSHRDIAAIEAAHDRSLFEGTSDASEAPAPASTSDATPLHAVRFYENRESLAKIVGTFLGEGFVSGRPAIVVATPEHRDAISRVLTAHYFDLTRLQAAGDLIMVDATETLAQFMRDGMPDPVYFKESMIPLIVQSCRGRADCVIRAYGEMVDVLWKAGQTAAAIRLEMLWNQLAQTHSFALLCGYSMGHFYKDVGKHEIQRQHTHVVSDSGEHVTLH